MRSQRSQNIPSGTRRGRPRKLPHRDLIKTAIIMISAGSKDSEVRQLWEKSVYRASKRTFQYYIQDIRHALVRGLIIPSSTSDLDPSSPQTPSRVRQPDPNLVAYVLAYIEVNGLAHDGSAVDESEGQSTIQREPSLITQLIENSQFRPLSATKSTGAWRHSTFDARNEVDLQTSHRRRTSFDNLSRLLRTLPESKASEPRNIDRPASMAQSPQSQHVRNLTQCSYTSTSTGVPSLLSASTSDQELRHTHMGQSGPMSPLTFGTSYGTESSFPEAADDSFTKQEMALDDARSQLHPTPHDDGGQQRNFQGVDGNSDTFFDHTHAGSSQLCVAQQMAASNGSGQETNWHTWNYSQVSTAGAVPMAGVYREAPDESYSEPFVMDDAIDTMLESTDTIQLHTQEQMCNTVCWSPRCTSPMSPAVVTRFNVKGAASEVHDISGANPTTNVAPQSFPARFADQSEVDTEAGYLFVNVDMNDLAASPAYDDFPLEDTSQMTGVQTASHAAVGGQHVERSNPIAITSTTSSNRTGGQSFANHTSQSFLTAFFGMQSPAQYNAAMAGELIAANLRRCPYYEQSSFEDQHEMANWVQQRAHPIRGPMAELRSPPAHFISYPQ